MALLLYVFTKISADLYAGALFITQATQYTSEAAIYIAILILLAIACVFTVAGGLSAVIWTDFVQTILMILGAFILCVQGTETSIIQLCCDIVITLFSIHFRVTKIANVM